MALTDLLQALGEDEDAQAAKLQEIIAASTESNKQITTLATSVQKLEERRDQLLEEKKKLAKAKALLTEAGIDPDSDDAETLLRAKLATKGEATDEASSLQFIEMKSAFNKLTSQVTELKTRAENAEEEKEQLKAKKVKADIKQAVLTQLDSATAGVCLSKTRLFQLNEGAFVMADDSETVLWKDGEDLKTIDDFAAASAANPEDAIFWAGRGSSGSGTQPGRPGLPESSAATKGNAFTVDGNATEAARMWKRDRKGAERLIAMARQKGNLAPAWARTLEMQGK